MYEPYVPYESYGSYGFHESHESYVPYGSYVPYQEKGQLERKAVRIMVPSWDCPDYAIAGTESTPFPPQ